MSKTVYRYQFDKKVPLQEVEDSLMLSVLAVESLHGRSALKLDASFLLDKGKRTCVVDGSCQAGQDIACIFTGFMTKEFGEDAFHVKRMDGNSHMEQNNWQRIPGLFNKREIEQLKKPGVEYYEEPSDKDSWGQDLFAVYFRVKGGE